MVGQGLKLSVTFSMKLLILLIGLIMSKLLALIERAKLLLIAEEIRQTLKN
jgi:hypothetical protein